MGAKVLVEQNKRRGPKPRFGKDNPCRNHAVSMPDSLWDWCVEQALFDEDAEGSASAYIVNLIVREKKRVKK